MREEEVETEVIIHSRLEKGGGKLLAENDTSFCAAKRARDSVLLALKIAKQKVLEKGLHEKKCFWRHKDEGLFFCL